MNSNNFLKRSVFVLAAGLLVGNVLGLAEIYYITQNLQTLAVASVPEFLQYLAGGALVYGLLFSLVLGGLSLVLEPLITDHSGENDRTRSLRTFSTILVTVTVFPVLTQTIYYDIPGVFEIPRFWNLGLVALLAGGLAFYVLRVDPFRKLLDKLSSILFARPVLWALLIANTGFLIVGYSVFYPQLPEGKSRTTAAGNPPVIVIGVDTLRADHLSPYSDRLNFPTPAADQLAEDGVVYRNNTAQWPKTTPSFASMFTSLYPAEIPVTSNSSSIPDRRTTFAERLRQAGYSTHGIVSSYAVHEKFLGQGFGTYVNREDWGLKNLKLLRYLLSLAGGDMPTSLAKQFLRSRSPDEPFLLFQHYIIPHTPYHPPFPHSLRYEKGYYWGKASGSQEALNKVRSAGVYRSRNDLRHIRALYDGEVAYTEAEILELLQTLKDVGLYQKSLIVYAADHGENMNQHGSENWFSHRTLYQSDLDVPLIIKYPGNKHAGTVVDQLTANLDIAPTILSETTADSLPVSRGTVLEPGSIHPREFVLSQKKYAASIRSENQKFILRYDTGERERYNLAEDPDETENLVTGEAKADSGYIRILEDFRKNYYRSDTDAARTEKDDTRLKGLGYIN